MPAHSWAAIENTGPTEPTLEVGRPSLWFVLEQNRTKQPVLEKTEAQTVAIPQAVSSSPGQLPQVHAEHNII